MGKNFRETLNEQMKDPKFRAEWEVLEPERQLVRAILDGKPLTSYTLEQIAEAADVSLEEARIMQNGRQVQQTQQPRVMQAGKQARAAVH